MRVKFYNAANQEEPEELRGDLRKIVWKHPRVVVGIITHYPIWYRFFEEVKRNGTYLVALYARDASIDPSWRQQIMSEVFSAIHRNLRDLNFMYAIWILLERGRIVTAYLDYCSRLLRGNIPCTENYEYFDPASFN